MSGWLGERFDIPRTISIATIIGSVGLLVISLESDLGFYLPALAVFGIGYGTGWAMASVGTQTVVPAEKAGAASGVTLAIVIGFGGLALAGAAMLLEAGSGDSAGLGSKIEDLLMWVAIGAAVVGVVLGIAAARYVPRRAPTAGQTA